MMAFFTLNYLPIKVNGIRRSCSIGLLSAVPEAQQSATVGVPILDTFILVSLPGAS